MTVFSITLESQAAYDYISLGDKTAKHDVRLEPHVRTSVSTPGTHRQIISRSPVTIIDESSTFFKALANLAQQGYKVNPQYVDYIYKNINTIAAGMDENQRATLIRHLTQMFHYKGTDEQVFSSSFYDTRGRTYHMTGDTLTFQGHQISRWALASPERYAVTASAYDYMLELFKHEGWVTTVEEARAFLANPTDDFAGIRAALTIIDIHETGMSDYMLEQDASCSGFQMMGLIMADTELLIATNVLMSPDGKRRDLYIETALAGDVHNTLFEGDMRAARKFCKPIVMLTGYGSGYRGLATRIWMDNDGAGEYEIHEETDEEYFVACEDTYITINKTSFNYASLMNYCKELQLKLMEKYPALKELRNLCMAEFVTQMKHSGNKLFAWWAPDGYRCERHITKTEQAKKLVKAAGSMPNIVHSVDACVVRHVLNNFKGTMGVVHDAFFSTINDAQAMQQCVIDGYRAIRGTSVAGIPVKYTGEITGPCVGISN